MTIQQSASSYRFFVQMGINIFLCKKAQQIIAKRVMKEQVISKKSYLIFVVFAITLFAVNQGTFMFFKDPNLYEKIGAPRRLSIAELKDWGDARRKFLLKQYSQNPKVVEQQLLEFNQILQVLTHPARRLSYDSFGYSTVDYAWAFKVPSFILSTIIGSGFFFVICTVVSMLNKKKSDLKQAFKAQICVMILLFIWEVDLIISTQSRFNNYSIDYIDYIYTYFPIFERRQMLKTIIIPCMSLVEIFVRYFMVSDAEKKIIEYGGLVSLHQLTLPVREAIGGGIRKDEHVEESVGVELQKIRRKQPVKTEIFQLQRQCLRLLLQLHRQQLVAKQKLGRIINYFIIQ